MTETTTPTPHSPQSRTRLSQRLAKLLLQNPVTVKELRSRMRGARSVTVLTIYLALLSGFITIVYLVYASAANEPFGPDPRQAGQPIFGIVLGIQVLLVTFLAPSFTASAVSGEKERQTYDLLRTTLLSANALVFGKLLSALSYVFLLILASVPLQSIAFLLGGISPVELIISQLLILVSAVTFALLGLFFSSLARSTLAASVSTFASSLFFTFGLPTLLLMSVGFLGAFLFASPTSPWQEALLLYGGMLLAAFNLPATIIFSEVVLREENAIFIFSQTFGGNTYYYLSPWVLYLIIYTLLALLLYWICVRLVRRIAIR